MKRIYIIINAALLLSIMLLSWANVRYTPLPEDKNVGKMPQLTALPPLPAVPLQLTAQDTVKMVEQNIFTPGRGKAEKNDNPAAAASVRPQLQLMGICMIGNSFGAIIVGKDSGSRPAFQSPAPPNGPPQHQTNPNPGGKPGKKNIEKRFFKLGDVVRDGFVLKEIKADSVLLVSSRDQMELKLQRGGRHSDGKNKAVVGGNSDKTKVQPIVSQVQILQHYDSLMQSNQAR